jgi:hypothetical protein
MFDLHTVAFSLGLGKSTVRTRTNTVSVGSGYVLILAFFFSQIENKENVVSVYT